MQSDKSLSFSLRISSSFPSRVIYLLHFVVIESHADVNVNRERASFNYILAGSRANRTILACKQRNCTYIIDRHGCYRHGVHSSEKLESDHETFA